MNNSYISADEAIHVPDVPSYEMCTAMCTENVSECSTVEYIYKTRTCSIYRPGTIQYSIKRSVSKTHLTTVATNICWKGKTDECKLKIIRANMVNNLLSTFKSGLNVNPLP